MRLQIKAVLLSLLILATGLLGTSILLPQLSFSGPADPLDASYRPAMDCTAGDYPSNVALSGPLIKLQQQSGSPAGIENSSPCLTVYAFANEIQSYQVHVQAPGGGYAALTIALSNLVCSTGPNCSTAQTISASSTSPYYMIPYQERYMDITTKSQQGYSMYGSTTGWYPDMLVPFVDPYYNQTTNAGSVAVTATQNQSYWVDVHVPSTAPSGYYLGSVTVKNSGTTIATLPLTYAVWQWPSSAGGYLSATPNLRYQAGLDYNATAGLGAYVGDSDPYDFPTYPHGGGQGAADDLAIMFQDNKLNIGFPQSYPDTGSFATYNSSYGPLINGTTGHVPAVMTGGKATLELAVNSASLSSAIINNWASNFNTNGWNPLLYYSGGSEDEPSSGTGMCNDAAITHAASPFEVPIWATTYMANVISFSAQNCVDTIVVNNGIMYPTGGPSTLGQYTTWLAGNCCGAGSPTRAIGKYISCYPSCGPGPYSFNYPTVDIDGTPANNRVMEWLSYEEGPDAGNLLTMEIYYSIDQCLFHNCKSGVSQPDPCASIYFFGHWGDGTLYYPGTGTESTYSPASSDPCYVGAIATPLYLPSMRMKMIRDGMQDYQYLYYLHGLGGTYATLANTEAASWVHNEQSYNVDPYAPATNSSGTYTGDLTDARYALGEAIHQITYPSGGGGTVSAPANPLIVRRTPVRPATLPFHVSAGDIAKFLLSASANLLIICP